MTCEFLPPTLTTRRACAAERIASATTVMRLGKRDSEIVLPDGTTCTVDYFPQWVEQAHDWSGSVGPERQAFFDGILKIDADRRLDASKPRPAADDLVAPIWGLLLAMVAAMLIAAAVYLIITGFAWVVETTTTATLAQATQAHFVEGSE